MKKDNISEMKPTTTTQKTLSIKEKLDKAAWSILGIMVGSYLLMMGFAMERERSFMFLGISILGISCFTGLAQYSGWELISKETKDLWGGLISKIGFGILAFLVVFGLLGSSVEGLHNIEKLNADQKQLVGSETKESQREFLSFACRAKTACKNYPDIRQSCAEAGNIQKCIDIRMKGGNSSRCLDNGGIAGFNDKTTPGFAQCTVFKIFELLN